MDIWNVLEWAAWIGSAGLIVWMVMDALQVNRDYSEELLLSSREGEIEIFSEKHHDAFSAGDGGPKA